MNIEEFFTRKHIVFDGATGTEFQRLGLSGGTPPEQWVFDKPDVLKDIHRAYVDAGSNVIETCTFGANRERLKASDLKNSIEKLNRRAVEIAREIAGNNVLVAGSVGPLGGILEPYGEISAAAAETIFAEQIAVLLEAKVDMIVIETMMWSQEALVAFRTAKQLGAQIVGVTMTFEPTPDGPRTSFGESVSDIVAAFRDEPLSFIGSNCGSGFPVMRDVVKEYLAATTLPLLIQSNAGIPTLENGRNRYPESPASFGQFAQEIAAMGVKMIGGCCGTTPAHIAEARKRIIT
jgi:5-methyltetrahydrofolate--homocysteine methyltransferase